MATQGVVVKQDRAAGKAILMPEKVTVGVLADRWLDKRAGDGLAPTTLDGYQYKVKTLKRRLGSKQVQALTFADVDAFRTWLKTAGHANGGALGSEAVKATLGVLVQVLDYAIKVERLITENVARGAVGKLAATSETLERWTAEHLMTFLARTDTDRLACAWRLACLGMRREEVLGLTWDNVDFKAGTVQIVRTRMAVERRRKASGWAMGPLKAANSKRILNPDNTFPGTMQMLRELKLASASNLVANPDGLVVTDEAGVPVMPRWFTARFQKLAAAAGVPVIRLHSTRHTAAYIMHEQGTPVVRAARFLGHSTKTHLDTYLFAREDDAALAGAAFGAALEGVKLA